VRERGKHLPRNLNPKPVVVGDFSSSFHATTKARL
jgi:hypothetical protein